MRTLYFYRFRYFDAMREQTAPTRTRMERGRVADDVGSIVLIEPSTTPSRTARSVPPENPAAITRSPRPFAKTGKSFVSYCPGGSRRATASLGRRPENPRVVIRHLLST